MLVEIIERCRVEEKTAGQDVTSLRLAGGDHINVVDASRRYGK